MILLEWWNLPFVLPFLMALLWLVLMTMGIGHFEHNIHLDHDIDHDIDHDVDSDSDAGSVVKVLEFFGIGKVPLTILLMSFCFLWGLVGWASNTLFQAYTPITPGVYFWFSLVCALVLSVFITRYLAKILAKVLPTSASYGIRTKELVGKVAMVHYEVNETFGSATLRDRYGALQEVTCIIKTGEKNIPPGAVVVLLSYDKEVNRFLVCPYEDDDSKLIHALDALT